MAVSKFYFLTLIHYMKKGLTVGAIALTSILLIGCQQAENPTPAESQENTTTDISVNVEPAQLTQSILQDGVTMKNGKMMMMKNGEMMSMTEEMTMDNGTKVDATGNVMMKDGTSMMMKDGQMMTMDGKMMDSISMGMGMGMGMDMDMDMDEAKMEGVMMKGGKMMSVWEGGQTMPMEKAVSMNNGATVALDGNVMMKDGTSMMMKEDQMMTMGGKMTTMADFMKSEASTKSDDDSATSATESETK